MLDRILAAVVATAFMATPLVGSNGGIQDELPPEIQLDRYLL